jgi:hypothetical protein
LQRETVLHKAFHNRTIAKNTRDSFETLSQSALQQQDKLER